MYQQFILSYFKQVGAEQCQADSKMPYENKWDKLGLSSAKLSSLSWVELVWVELGWGWGEELALKWSWSSLELVLD